MDKRSSCIVKSSLPDDIIFYLILPRVPAEMLHSWRFVCKQWLHMLSNGPGFLDAQLVLSRPRFIFHVYNEFGREAAYRKRVDVEITFNNITRTITSFTSEDFVLNNSDWISDKEYFKVDAFSWTYVYLNSSCKGLILLYRYQEVKGHMYYIVNPATRQWVVLPKCEYSSSSKLGLGYDLATKKFKVVQIYIRWIPLPYLTDLTEIPSCKCAVLTLGSNKWREIRYPFENVDGLEPSLYVNGFMHFKCRAGPESPSYNTFVSMDITNETFQRIRPPDGVRDGFTIFKLGDCLALSPLDGNLDIWILEDCSKGLWSKKYSSTMNLHYGCQKRGLVGSLPDTLRPIGAFNSGEGDVVIYKEENGYRLFYYVTWSNELKELDSPWKTKPRREGRRTDPIIQAANHVGTLVSPHDLVSKSA